MYWLHFAIDQRQSSRCRFMSPVCFKDLERAPCSVNAHTRMHIHTHKHVPGASSHVALMWAVTFRNVRRLAKQTMSVTQQWGGQPSMPNGERTIHQGCRIGGDDTGMTFGEPFQGQNHPDRSHGSASAGNRERNDALGGVTIPPRRWRRCSSWLPVLMATLLMRGDQTKRRPGHIKREETGLLPAESGLNYFIKWSAYKVAGLRHHAASQSFQAARPHLGSSIVVGEEVKETCWALMVNTWDDSIAEEKTVSHGIINSLWREQNCLCVWFPLSLKANQIRVGGSVWIRRLWEWLTRGQQCWALSLRNIYCASFEIVPNKSLLCNVQCWQTINY